MVSTGPLFSSLLACLVSPISAIAQQTPTPGTHAHSIHVSGDMSHVQTCEMAVNNVKGSSLSLPSTFCSSSEQLKSVLYQSKKDRYLNFTIWMSVPWQPRSIVWPQNGFRSNLRMSTFSEGGMPPDSSSCCVFILRPYQNNKLHPQGKSQTCVYLNPSSISSWTRQLLLTSLSI